MKARYLCLAAALLSAVGCSAPVAHYRCDFDARGVEPDVTTVWKCNRDVIERVVDGERFSLREFRGAARFFSESTGIPADTRETRQGTQPGLGLRENLDQWDAWYVAHRDSLVWDERSGTVRPAAGGAS
ncbi:MAG TPA: hypothetical protein VD788_09745 [Candidatus Polarisedimenticolaceae bacterium]|nr:hypothetical protein [Candidatus Polarisedimenticolaceae bacterium]